MACFEHAPGPDAFDPIGVEVRSVIFPQDFLPDRSSEWARLHFAGRKRGFELVVGSMIGLVKGGGRARARHREFSRALIFQWALAGKAPSPRFPRVF